MASLTVDTPDGKTLTVDVPEGTDPSKYGALADDAVSHYTANNPASESGPMSFLRGVGNQMPLGKQFSALVSPGSYSDNLAAQNAVTESDKTAHPVAYGSGAVAGAVAPAMIPGVGEAMAANPMTAGALFGGAGAISDTDLKQHPVQGAAQAATGMATGALLNGLISKIMPAPQTLENKANTLANKSINMPAGHLVDMTPEEQQAQGAFLRDNGLVGKDKSQVLGKARDLIADYGQKIGSIGQGMTKKGLTVEDSGLLTQPLVDKAERYALLEDPEANSLYKTYMAGAKAIASKGESPSWSDLQSLKETYGPLAFKSTGEVKNQAAADVYFTLSNALKDIADKASTNPDISSEYRQALTGYSRMSPIVDGLEKAVDSDLRGGGAGMGVRGIVGLVKRLPGPVRAVVGPVAAAMGHPYVGMAAALPELLDPSVQSNALGGLAKQIPGIQTGLNRVADSAATSPEAQAKVMDMFEKLKKKWGTPLSNRK